MRDEPTAGKLTSSRRTESDSTVLTVMTFNLANGLARPRELIDALRTSNADIIGLQELDETQAAAIREHLPGDYPHMRLHPLGIPGKGLLSRFPILSSDLLHFLPARPDLRATIELPGVNLRVVIAHPPPPKLDRNGIGPTPATRRQIIGLLQIVNDGGPCILMGDFNLPDRHPVYRLIANAGLTDAFRAAGRGSGATLPKRITRFAYRGNPLGNVPLPVFMRVDYIWLTPHLEAREAWVGEHAGSDHLPVLAKLEIVAEDEITLATRRNVRTEPPRAPRLARWRR